MKNVVFVVLGLTMLWPAAASAGPLYGTVKIQQTNMPAAGARISVACPSFSRPAQPPTDVVADGRGSFSMRVPANGRCEMRVQRDNKVGAAFEVFVSNNPMRFDFAIDGASNRMR